jgi:phosphotriesterase-related protein
LLRRWVAEWRNGIEGTGIKPGFIKIGVDPGPLSEIDRKLVVAAARTHLQTGLTIACHTGEAKAALEVLEVVKSEGVDPSALIIVHADSIPDQSVHEKLAKEGAWVEYDAIGAKPINEHVRLISEMVRKGFADKLLLSHDAGWYWVGEPNGGKEKIRPYTALSDELIPALKNAGLTEATLKRLLVENPKEAFTVRIRKR